MKYFEKAFRYVVVTLTLLFSRFLLMAQDKGLDIDISVDKKEWYEQPWVWVVGAAVFVLILVAILRGGRKK